MVVAIVCWCTRPFLQQDRPPKPEAVPKFLAKLTAAFITALNSSTFTVVVACLGPLPSMLLWKG